jgi:hypothetical protein
MQNFATKLSLSCMIILSVFFASNLTASAGAQTTSGLRHPALKVAQAASEGMMAPGMMMGQGMMGGGMMHPGMMGAMPMGMRGHVMKIMFAIADTDGDGGLSFEEVTAIHKRIFDNVDANKDGKVTPEEFQSFVRD